MKKKSFKYLLLIISVAFFSTNTFAQAPPDPGSDPLKSDTTKEITALQTEATLPSNVHSIFLSERKNSINLNKRSDTLLLRKNDEENLNTSSK
jgi:hypothetical protein